MKMQYIAGWVETKAGKVPKVSTELSRADKWGSFKVRWAFSRMSYIVEPGVYAVGNPDQSSIVLVSANYKLSFDILRRELKGLDAWIMVLDTKGINVWCAAGKGTFGTREIVNRIELSKLKEIVGHRKLILPQLGAPGVAVHEVKKLSGFLVIYGPVRAPDILPFLEAGMVASREMRQVRFSFYDRFLLIPVELMTGLRYLLFIVAAFFLLAGLSRDGYSTAMAADVGIRSTINLLLAYLAGTIVSPLLLPWLPGRSFSLKGLFPGLGLFIILFFVKLLGESSVEIVAWMFIIPALSSFITMNFTGASTYTSLSGVKKEMRVALPLQITAAVIGSILWIVNRFI